jgi:EAL domain-containing protein (putative c-di-GMP-specific phosphodiesterase class I)/GGDEF domain-containing protein
MRLFVALQRNDLETFEATTVWLIRAAFLDPASLPVATELEPVWSSARARSEDRRWALWALAGMAALCLGSADPHSALLYARRFSVVTGGRRLPPAVSFVEGWVALALDDLVVAARAFDEARRIENDPRLRVAALCGRAQAAQLAGHHAEARSAALEARTLSGSEAVLARFASDILAAADAALSGGETEATRTSSQSVATSAEDVPAPVDVEALAARIDALERERVARENHVAALTARVEEGLSLPRLDPLTMLATRQTLHRWLNTHLAAGPWWVVTVDVVGLRAVNRVLGEVCGDAALVSLASRARALCPPSGMASRWGDDRFVIVVPDEHWRATNVASLRRRVVVDAAAEGVGEDVVSVETRTRVFTAPVGVTADELLDWIEQSFGAATEEDRSTGTGFARLALLERDPTALLREGLQRGLLSIDLQPQFHNLTGETIGAETLLRMDHPLHGRLEPALFLNPAALAAFGGDLTSWLLDQLVQFVHEHRDDRDPLLFSLNLAVEQLDDSLVTAVKTALAETPELVKRLSVEVPADDLERASSQHVEVLLELRDLGISIVLDNVDWRNAPLDLLARVPVDAMKFSRDAVVRLTSDSEDADSAATMVENARRNDVAVIAQGVETAAEFDAQRAIGCAAAQGYLMARPAPMDSENPSGKSPKVERSCEGSAF